MGDLLIAEDIGNQCHTYPYEVDNFRPLALADVSGQLIWFATYLA